MPQRMRIWLNLKIELILVNVDILIVHNANPLYALPNSLNIEKTFEKIPYKISFSSCLDETTKLL